MRGAQAVAQRADLGPIMMVADHQEEHQAKFSSKTMPAPVMEAGAK